MLWCVQSESDIVLCINTPIGPAVCVLCARYPSQVFTRNILASVAFIVFVVCPAQSPELGKKFAGVSGGLDC